MKNADHHSGRYTSHLLATMVASSVLVFTACLPSPGKWAVLVGMLSIAFALGQALEMVGIRLQWTSWDETQRCAFVSGIMLGWFLNVAGYASVLDHLDGPLSLAVGIGGLAVAVITFFELVVLVAGTQDILQTNTTSFLLSATWLSTAGVYFSRLALTWLRAWVASL